MCSDPYLPITGLPNSPSWVVFNPLFVCVGCSGWLPGSCYVNHTTVFGVFETVLLCFWVVASLLFISTALKCSGLLPGHYYVVAKMFGVVGRALL